ncbi:MAG: AraC family transcriptional regulator [Chitinophagaceae bacterium]|nr:AraC family transcriptional regulator [Chitinophagaceae bacterium]
MVYEKFRPSDELNPFIECYFTWHSSGVSANGLVVESPPNGFCSIVFNLGDEYILHNKKYNNLVVPRQFVSGQSIYSYSLHFNGIINLCGIVFKPAALASLCNLPTFEYTEERIPLDNIFKKPAVNAIAEALSAEKDNAGKARILETFVLDIYRENKPEPDYIDWAANEIIEKNGMVDVTELMKHVYMSRRNFERKFFRKVGLSPKYYARLTRLAYLLNLIAGKKKADWGALFSECEFYDQSHFIKDFVEFTGRTPQQYLEENRELANLVDKPKPHSID